MAEQELVRLLDQGKDVKFDANKYSILDIDQAIGNLVRIEHTRYRQGPFLFGGAGLSWTPRIIETGQYKYKVEQDENNKKLLTVKFTPYNPEIKDTDRCYACGPGRNGCRRCENY